MLFGKYGPKKFPPNGVDICFINSGYLKWLLEQDWFVEGYDKLFVAVEEELALRDRSDAHFYDDLVRGGD